MKDGTFTNNHKPLEGLQKLDIKESNQRRKKERRLQRSDIKNRKDQKITGKTSKKVAKTHWIHKKFRETFHKISKAIIGSNQVIGTSLDRKVLLNWVIKTHYGNSWSGL